MAAPGTAVSISASAKTMSGDLPPSSSEIRLRLPADARTIDWPVTCEPVKATLSPPACEASAAPAVAGHDVDHAGGNAGFHRQFAEPERRQRRLFGRLENDRAA